MNMIDNQYCILIQEFYEYIPSFFGETEKPYDEWIKMQPGYDPRTNTYEVKRKNYSGDEDKMVRIAPPKLSKKQHNRVNKFLRENDFDPKTNTIRSDISYKGKDNIRVPYELVTDPADFDYLTTGPHFIGTDDKSYVSGTPETVDIDYDRNIPLEERDPSKAVIRMPIYSIAGKPAQSNFHNKHEEGHFDVYLNQPKYRDEFNKAKEFVDRYESENENTLHDQGDLHAIHPEEYSVDKYSLQHNPYLKNKSPEVVARTYKGGLEHLGYDIQKQGIQYGRKYVKNIAKKSIQPILQNAGVDKIQSPEDRKKIIDYCKSISDPEQYEYLNNMINAKNHEEFIHALYDFGLTQKDDYGQQRNNTYTERRNQSIEVNKIGKKLTPMIPEQFARAKYAKQNQIDNMRNDLGNNIKRK